MDIEQEIRTDAEERMRGFAIRWPGAKMPAFEGFAVAALIRLLQQAYDRIERLESER